MRLLQRTMLTVCGAAYLLFTLFPIYWLINSALKGNRELFAFPPHYLPQSPTFSNFVNAATQTRLPALYLNSAIVSVLTCLILAGLIIFSGYALDRFRFRGKSLILILFFVSQMLPHVVLLVPFFTVHRALGIINTYWSLVLTYIFTWLPFSVLMMRSYYKSIPKEIDEAALVDGCSRTTALFQVVLPSALPGVVATLIFAFINAWNELIYAIVFISDPKLQTLPVGLMSLMGENRTDWGLVMAVAVLSLVPTLLLFGYIQRFLTSGFAASAVKG